MKKTLVVLAAGIGSRYGGLKQMDPIGPSGEFIVDYSVYDAIKAGFNHIVFVLRKEIEGVFNQTIGDRISSHVSVEYVFQEMFNIPEGYFLPVDRKKPWGTGHAVLMSSDVVDTPFAVINADDFYGRESYEALSRFMDETADDQSKYAMVGYKLEETLSDYGTVSRGICKVGQTSLLESIVERTGICRKDGQVQFEMDANQHGYLSGKELVSMNIWGFKPSVFPFLKAGFADFLRINAKNNTAEYFLPTEINNLMTEKKISVKVLSTSSPWFGVTNPQDKPIVQTKIYSLIEQGVYPSKLWP